MSLRCGLTPCYVVPETDTRCRTRWPGTDTRCAMWTETPCAMWTETLCGCQGAEIWFTQRSGAAAARQERYVVHPPPDLPTRLTQAVMLPEPLCMAASNGFSPTRSHHSGCYPPMRRHIPHASFCRSPVLAWRMVLCAFGRDVRY
eukprot:857232-Rhodomonas_salina.3